MLEIKPIKGKFSNWINERLLGNKKVKTHKNIFEKCLDKDVIRTAIIDAAKGKRKRNDVKIVLANMDYYVEMVYAQLKDKTYIPHVPAETR